MLGEKWKDVVGYEDYFLVSDLGRVFSKRTNRILKQYLNKSRRMSLSTWVEGKRVTFRIHRLVAEAFLLNPENKPTVNHKDGNPSNNFLVNLEWATYSENEQHAYDTGLRKSKEGADHHNSVLTEENIKFIRDNYKLGCRCFGARALAKKFKTVHTVILRLINNLTYKNLSI